ncbi:hypothetical protein OQA88_12738 [Cercophora sp. LCS_1]
MSSTVRLSSDMRKYFIRLENNAHLPTDTPGHGFSGWLSTSTPNITHYALTQPSRFAIFRQLAQSLGHDPSTLLSLMRRDVNSISPNRDSQTGIFNFPFHNTPLGNRTNADILLASTIAQGHPLTIQLESLVTRVLLTDDAIPRAIGVEYIQGKSLYRADPRSSKTSPFPAPKAVYARKGVILSAGVFNTPQLLQLSGIGSEVELARFNIPVVVDLPGVGTGLKDDNEISLAAVSPVSLAQENNCTLGIEPDPCIELWKEGRGLYTVPGASHSVHFRSSVAKDGERDVVMWNPPGVFRGFCPGYSGPQGDDDGTFGFAMVHTQSRNTGGTVKLRTGDARDVPEIQFDFWSKGAEEDLQALYEGVEFARSVLGRVPEPVGPLREIQPSAATGRDEDPMAVLDGRFRVRGTKGLRVVDGSALPRVPSPFPIVGLWMVSMRAGEMIVEDAQKSE